MSLEIRTGEALARTLHRETELMKQSWDVLRVVVHAEALLDPLADKRSGPHAGLKSRRLRTGLDDARDLGPLLFRQSRRTPRQQPGAQPLGALRIVPTGPLRDGRAVHADLLREVDGCAAIDVAEHAFRSPPHRQVLQGSRLTQKLSQSLHLSRLQPRCPNRLPIACSPHGRTSQHTRPPMDREMTTVLREAV